MDTVTTKINHHGTFLLQQTNTIIKKAVFGFILFLPFTAWADYTLTMHGTIVEDNGYQTSTLQTKNVFEYKNDTHMKMKVLTNGKVASETYVVGKNCYLVTHHGDKTQIIDYDAMQARAKAAMAKIKAEEKMMQTSQSTQKDKEEPSQLPRHATWQNTGKRVKVGDLIGEEWIARYTNKEGKEEQQTFILSNNKNLVKAVKAYGRFIARTWMHNQSAAHKKAAEYAFVPKPGYALLKASDNYTFVSLSDAFIHSSAFQLPKGKIRTTPDYSSYFSSKTTANQVSKSKSQTNIPKENTASTQTLHQENTQKKTDGTSIVNTVVDKAVDKGVDKAVDAIKNFF
jgi:hypothetical protein